MIALDSIFWKKFEDLTVNRIVIDTDELKMDQIIYIDFEHFPSIEFDTIGDIVATITCKNVSEEQANIIVMNFKQNFSSSVLVGTKSEIYG